MADEGEPAQNEEAQNEDVQEQPPPQEEPPMEQAPQEAEAPAEGEPPQESEPPAMEPPQEGEPPAEKAEQEGEPPAAEASQEGETATTEGQQEGESLAAESKQEGEPPESLAEGAAPDAETDLEFNLEGDVIETSEVEEVKSSDLFNASVDVTGEEGPVEQGEESPSAVVEEESIGGADSLQAEETELVNTDFKIKQETDTITLQSFPVIPDEVPPLGEEEDQLEYKTQHRFEDEPQVERISGDFTALNLMPIVTARISKATIESYHSEKEGEEEGEPSVFEEEVPEVLDRAPYYELHEKLTQEHITHKIKNNFLHRKMAEYFKKRKMEHVLKETEQQVDTQQKYGKRLDALAELMEIDERKRTIINAEINELTATRDEKLESITVAFKQMQDREKEISTGLINTKTGKELPQKLIERLLRRQSITAQQVADLRLKYIKIRDRVNEKQAKLQDLDKLGDNLRIIDYEQLKVENRSHADKIEERDEELTRLRRKCESSSQILAHMREKSASATLDLIENTKRLEEVEIECMEARERANFFKQQRDYYRMLTNKLIQDSGLLTHPKLLQDMEEAIADVENNSAKLKELQMTYEIQTQKIRAIRKNIEIAPFRMQLRKKSGDKKDKDAPTYYKRRPTLMVPKLPVQFLYYHKSRRINPFKKK